MPRSVYNQSPGNPTQVRHLPSEPMQLEFAYQCGMDTGDKKLTARVLAKLAFVSGIAMAIYLVDTWAMSWFPLNLVIVVMVVWNVAQRSDPAEHTDAMLSASLLVAAWLYRWFPLPLPLEVAIASITVALVSREVARHYAFVATTSPMDRETAWSLRDSADWWTVLTSSLIFPVGLGVCVPQVFAPCCCVSLLLLAAVAISSWDQLPYLWHRYLKAIRSWCSYNCDDSTAPGMVASPAGTCRRRLQLLAIVVLLLAILQARLTFATDLVLPHVAYPGWLPVANDPLRLVLQGVLFIAALAAWGLVPVLLLLGSILVTSLPVLTRFQLPSTRVVSPQEWQRITTQIRQSSNPIERESVYLGRLVHDHSPLLVPRAVFQEHAHFLGDSGSGKTARGLTPLAEQLISDGKSSLMVIDLKGDSGELLESIRQAAGSARETAGRNIQVRYFNTREDASTYAFNPLQLASWNRLNLFQKTDILCGAMGLVYGTDYGEGYFSSANASILYATLKHFPEACSFREIADRIGYVVARPKAHGIDEQTKNAGNHVRMAMVRLASFAALNVTPNDAPNQEVVDQMMDPSRLFQQPEVHYFHLSATLGPGSSPEIGRLAVYMLLMSATLSRRNLPVYLVIDEFQRMAAHNLDYMLQLARGMGVGVILANQSVQDLKHDHLVSVLETNCRYRQWFAVSGWDDQERICKASGETIDSMDTVSASQSHSDRGVTRSFTRSSQQIIAPRLTRNNIKLISDDDRQSIVLINRGAGYSQYGGLPIAVESDFHISKEEFVRRKNTPWPQGARGTFVPEQWQPQAEAPPRKGRKKKQSVPVMTHETIDEQRASSAQTLFDRYLADHPMSTPENEQ